MSVTSIFSKFLGILRTSEFTLAHVSPDYNLFIYLKWFLTHIKSCKCRASVITVSLNIYALIYPPASVCSNEAKASVLTVDVTVFLWAAVGQGFRKLIDFISFVIQEKVSFLFYRLLHLLDAHFSDLSQNLVIRPLDLAISQRNYR